MKSSRAGHLKRAIGHLRELELAELTVPGKPQSRKQKIRLTAKGQKWFASKSKGDSRKE